jgi:hypothetical protein
MSDSTSVLARMQCTTKLLVVPSVDGCLAAAACLHNLKPSVQVRLATPDRPLTSLDRNWRNERLLLVNFAPSENRDRLFEFLQIINQRRHQLVGICDEHDSASWSNALSVCGIPLRSLVITPKDRAAGFRSSGAVLLDALGESADEHTRTLCALANDADQGIYSGLGELFRKVIRAPNKDMKRRTACIWALSKSLQPTDQMRSWAAEYDYAVSAQEQLLRHVVDLGEGLGRVECGAVEVDPIYLIESSIGKNHRVLLVRHRRARTEKPVELLTIITQEVGIDLFHLMSAVGIRCEGRVRKVTIPVSEESKAISILQAALRICSARYPAEYRPIGSYPSSSATSASAAITG